MAETRDEERSRAAVRAFLSQADGSSDSDFETSGEAGEKENYDSEDTEQTEKGLLATRNPRLGLGATPKPGSQNALSEVERRLLGRIRAAQRQNTEVDAENERWESQKSKPGSVREADDECPAEGSKSATLGRKRLSKKRRTRRDDTEYPDNTSTAGAQKADSENKKRGSENARPAVKPNVEDSNPNRSAARTEGTVSSAQDAPERDEVAANQDTRRASYDALKRGSDTSAPRPRKRTKTRSRQKNLRRDKRPKDALPEHLTAETLRKRLAPAGPARGSRDKGASWVADEAS